MTEEEKEFASLCRDRGPPNETYASIYTETGERLAEMGESVRMCNLYSSTKSLVGLVIAHDTLFDNFDPMQDISGWLRLIVRKDVFVPDGVPLMALLNHCSGISRIQLSDPLNALDLITRRKNTQATIGDYLTSINPANAPFFYSPILGYMVAGAVYELIKKEKNRDFTIKKRCQELFFPAGWREGRDWEWTECHGVELCKHTYAFSNFYTTGRGMQQLGQNLLRNHLPLLKFILARKTPGSYVRHARSSRASGGSDRAGGEVAVDYDYSFGWWLLPAAETLTTIGLGGQYIVLNLQDKVVGVRQQATLLNNVRAPWVIEEIKSKKRGYVLSTHETFPLLVRDYAERRAVDRDLEKLLLFQPGEFELADAICKEIINGPKSAWAKAVLLPGGYFDGKYEMADYEIEDAVIRTLVWMKRAGPLLIDWAAAIQHWDGMRRPAGSDSMGVFAIYFMWIVSKRIKEVRLS